MNRILSVIMIGLLGWANTVLTNESGVELVTENQDWRTVIIETQQNRGMISYTSSKDAGMLGVACEFSGQQYDNVHFFTPSYKPLININGDDSRYVDVYLKAGPTEFSTSLLAGQASNGIDRLYYPTHLSNASIIKRLIEARELKASYKMANGQSVTETFSLMGYTHNVSLNVQFCDNLNQKISMNTLANTPENAKIPPENSPDVADSGIGMGTCFGVSPNGHVVTNNHVIADAKEIFVRTSNGDLFQAEVLTTTPSTDLAVLKIKAEQTDYLPIKSSRSVNKGDKVFTIGYPMASMLGTEAKYTEGVISAKSGLGGEPLAYQVTVPIQPGNSGGPLVNEQGEVIGVITSTASSLKFLQETGNMPQNINWAVKSDYLTPLLDQVHEGRSTDSHAQAITAVEDAICMVVTRS